MLEPSPRFKIVPVLAVWGDFQDSFVERGLAESGDLVTRAKAVGGKAKLVHLPQEGFVGNSHMLMMDRNNLRSPMQSSWLRDNVN